jgi:hypothetical protein
VNADRRELDRYEARIESLFDSAKALEHEEMEIVSHLARYMCVLCSGYLEVSLRNLCVRYAHRRGSETVVTYVRKTLRVSTQNPKMETFLTILASFDAELRSDFESYALGARADAINGVVDTKNKIAHGVDTGVGLRTVHDWYLECRDALRYLERRLGVED